GHDRAPRTGMSAGHDPRGQQTRFRKRAMATISAADVKKLRDLTGAGMMDSKNALTEADGDFDKAVETLRIKAGAKVNKLGAREATNGLIAAAEGAMIQLSCETDFVAKNEDFQTLAANIV